MSRNFIAKRDPKAVFLDHLRWAGLPTPATEHVFARPRRWRFDYAYPEWKIAIEYQGVFGARNASHASLSGLMRDYRKFTEAALRGWLVILIDANSVRTGEAVIWVERALRSRQGAQPNAGRQ